MLKRKTLEIDWVVEETATLVKKARLRQAHRIYSEPCEGWKLSAQTQQDKTHLGIYLYPVELKKETRVTFELKATPEAHKDLCYGRFECPGKTFAPDAGGWGSNFLNETALRRVGKHRLLITCKITWGEEEKAAPTANYLKTFNKQAYSDTALVHAEGRYTIFVQSAVLQESEHFKTILDSNFSESKSTTRLPASSPPARDDRFLGDVSEFAAFGVRKASSQDQKPEQDVAASQDYNVADESAAHRSSVSPSDASGGQELVPLREFRLVKVPDCSYATLSTYLAYLYTPKLDFLPSPAFFLAEEKEPGSATESDFSRWSARKAKTGTYPSLPHALYRLADCYMESAIKARAKGWILQNITVETAPFELFSQLSLDYPEFQADVIDFVLTNLDDVTATPGWKRAVALIDEGKIPGGGSILNKLLSNARKGTD